ncbi:carotenoid ester lipase precursor [Multifurca ochricompacta]|uniref:Carboxylic ester hydrolase n=1 Tax=Multifurca ochricompacta TaxID=376703 RepID=A0AAD4QLG4_9AGAM|nr:carotenoid ester lipase precursor [Multifurca ochricompacta]
MRVIHVALALFVRQAVFALATSTRRPFVVQQKSNTPLVGTKFYGSAPSAPQAYLDNATFTGIYIGRTARFLGIPYAQPPTCNRRLRLPEPLPPYEGHYDVHKFGPSCPQQRLILPIGLNTGLEKDVSSIVTSLYEDVTTDSEDCLTINVVTPVSATPSSGLPVVVWFFGGGFEIGGTATYDGGVIVSRSIEIGEPVIFVSMNYRISALGFLPGKEVKEAKIGNLGLQDQRLSLKWIQKYISAFGGDPSKVTIWGESAGAISVALHMLVNQGDQQGLFRGAIMQSGGPIPVGDIEHGQQYYDALVKNAACDNSPDTLECLRNVPFPRLKYAMDISPNFFAYQGLTLAWLPRVDGVFLTEPPQYAVLRGHVANVPMITGNCDDEGSLFSLSSLNISGTDDLRVYMKSFMLPSAAPNELDLLLQYYPDNQLAGCPFDTGIRNELGPQFKRIAAIQGDIVFHGPRRFFLTHQARKQSSWAFIHKRGKDTPFVGAVSTRDRPSEFVWWGELADYIIYFTRNLNPNGKLGIKWPQYNLRNPKALIFQDDPFFPVIVGDDNYRANSLEFVANLSLLHPI